MIKQLLIQLAKYCGISNSVKKVTKIFSLLTLFVFSTFSSATNVDTNSALVLFENDHFDSLKIADKASMPSANKIFVGEVALNFDKDWLVEFQNQTSKNYRQRIESDYAAMLKEHLVNKLNAAGWTVLEKPEPNVLTLHAEFKDLYINAPQVRMLRNALVNSVGKASIVLTLNDTDEKPFVVIEDHRNASAIAGGLMETDRALNYSMFSRLTENWASAFVVYLDLIVPETVNETEVLAE